MAYSPPRLPKELLSAVLKHSIDNLIPPSDLVRFSAGLKSKEPFLFDPSSLPRAGQQQTRLVLVLSHLYQCAPTAFDKAAPTIRGRRRVYFGQSYEEVSSTGESNSAMAIPKSPWFVSVNQDFARKATIVKRLMEKMGFSSDYADMISSLAYRSKARLPWPYRQFADKQTS